RLTLHFNGPVTANLFNLKPDHGLGHRLVVDLFPTAPAAGPGQAPAAPRELALPRHDETILDGGEGATVAPALEELWLDARLNNQRERTTVLALRRGADEVLLGGEDLRNWRINPPQGGALEHGGERFHPLSRLGVEGRLDLRRLTLDLDAPANLFGATRLAGPRRDPLPLTPSPLGAFANYDLSATRGDDGEVRAAGLFELGVFNGWGSGTANLLARRDPDGRERELVRWRPLCRPPVGHQFQLPAGISHPAAAVHGRRGGPALHPRPLRQRRPAAAPGGAPRAVHHRRDSHRHRAGPDPPGGAGHPRQGAGNHPGLLRQPATAPGGVAGVRGGAGGDPRELRPRQFRLRPPPRRRHLARRDQRPPHAGGPRPAARRGWRER